MNEDFLADPTGFLDTHAMIVSNDLDQVAKARGAGVYNFKLSTMGHNAVKLGLGSAGGDHPLKGYYLPWSPLTVTSMRLGAEADFFFTSQLTNCRFSILDADPTQPLVAHVAGDIHEDGFTPSQARTRKEEADWIPATVPPARPRRFSISGSKDVRRWENGAWVYDARKQHDYRGMNGTPAPSSAFVFGRRNTGDGRWTFHAQVTKGVLNSLIEVSADLTILRYTQAETLVPL